MLLKVTIFSFCFVSCIHHHACPCHVSSHRQHHPISPFPFFPISLLVNIVPFLLDLMHFHQLDFVIRTYIKPLSHCLFFVCLCIEQTKCISACMTMNWYNCEGRVTMAYDNGDVAGVRISHHRSHHPYLDISIPKEVDSIIEEMKDYPAAKVH